MTEEYGTPTYVDGICTAASPGPNAHGYVDFQIQVEGLQYPVKVSTKLPQVVEKARQLGQAPGRWHYTPSQGGENKKAPGTFFTNRQLSNAEPLSSLGAPAVADSSPAAPADQPVAAASGAAAPAPPAALPPLTEKDKHAIAAMPAVVADGTAGRIARSCAVKALKDTVNQIAVMPHGPDRTNLEAAVLGLAARVASFIENGPAQDTDPDQIPF